MTAEQVKLRSSIKETLKKFVLIRGSLLAIIGCLMLYATLFIPPEHLKYWGFPILILAGTLVAVGLVPYRTLIKREKNPDEIVLEGNTAMHYNAQGEPTISIPYDNIDRFSYLEKGKLYGIGLWLKQPQGNSIQVHHPKFDLEKYLKDSQKKYECDLFFPYFTQRSFNILTAFNKEDE